MGDLDFSKLGGMGGLGSMDDGADDLGMTGTGDDEDVESDDDMPDLTSDTTVEGKGKEPAAA